MGYRTSNIPDRVAAGIAFSQSEGAPSEAATASQQDEPALTQSMTLWLILPLGFTISRFLKLVQKVVRHRSRKRHLKLHHSPRPGNRTGDAFCARFLCNVLESWEALPRAGIRIGTGNRWCHLRIEQAMSLSPPSPPTRRKVGAKATIRHRLLELQGQALQKESNKSRLQGLHVPPTELAETIKAYTSTTTIQANQVRRAGRTALRKYRRFQQCQGSLPAGHGNSLSPSMQRHAKFHQAEDGPHRLRRNGPRRQDGEKLRQRMVFDQRGSSSSFRKACLKLAQRDCFSTSPTPDHQPRLYVHNSAIWQTLVGHSKDFQGIPRFEWQALLGIASMGREGILQPALCKLTGQDKRSLPNRTTQLAKKGYITKRSVLKRGMKTSKMWIKKLAPPILDSGPVDISRIALVGSMDAVPWHGRWTGETIDYLAFGQTAVAIIRAHGVMKHLDLKRKMGVYKMKWQMRVLARSLRYWADCGVVKYVAASLDGQMFRDCLKYVQAPTEAQWRKYLATGGLKKSRLKGARLEEVMEKARKGTQAAAKASASGTSFEPAWRYIDFSKWIPERPIICTLFQAIKTSGSEGATNKQISSKILTRDFERLVSRIALAITNPTPPRHLNHLQAVNRKVRTGKVLQYRYFAGQACSQVPAAENQQALGPDVETALYEPLRFSAMNSIMICQSPTSLTELVKKTDKNANRKKNAPKSSMGGRERGKGKGRGLGGRSTRLREALPSKAPKSFLDNATQPDGEGSPTSPEPPPHNTQASHASLQIITNGNGKRTQNEEEGSQKAAALFDKASPEKVPVQSEDSAAREHPTKKPRTEKVYLGDKNSLDPGPKKLGRPRKSLVTVFNLNAFSGKRERLRLDSTRTTLEKKRPNADAVETQLTVESPNPLTASPMSIDHQTSAPAEKRVRFSGTVEVQEVVNSGQVEEPDVEDATLPAKSGPGRGGVSVGRSKTRGGRRKGKNNAPLGGFKCDKCGQTWRNSNGLEYHLTKARTSCNPNYHPDDIMVSVRTPTRPSRRPAASPPKIQVGVPMSATGRPMRSTRLGTVHDAADLGTDGAGTRKTRKSSTRVKGLEASGISATHQLVHRADASKTFGDPLSTIKPWRKRKKRTETGLLTTPGFGHQVASKILDSGVQGDHHISEMVSRCQPFGLIDIADAHLESTRGQAPYNDRRGLVYDKFTKTQDASQSNAGKTQTPSGKVERTTITKAATRPDKRDESPTGQPTLSVPAAEPDSPGQGLFDGSTKIMTKIAGLWTGESNPTQEEEVVIPGEVNGFVPRPFPVETHAEKSCKIITRAPVHFWLRTILHHLCCQNGGVFPGDKAAYVALLQIWHQHLSKIPAPKERTMKRAINESHDFGPEVKSLCFQDVYLGRYPVNFQIIYLGGTDPKGDLANLVKKRVFAAHPNIYIPNAFAPNPSDFPLLGVGVEKPRERGHPGSVGRRIPREIEHLDAPFYIVESRTGTGAKRPSDSNNNNTDTGRPGKRRKLWNLWDGESPVDAQPVLGRPRDRTWSCVERGFVLMQDFGTGTWNAMPQPVFDQRWPRTMVRKKPYPRNTNPGLHTLPPFFWGEFFIETTNSRPFSSSFPSSLDDVPGTAFAVPLSRPESQPWEVHLEHFNHDCQRIKDWELSEKLRGLVLVNNIMASRPCFINLQPPPDSFRPHPHGHLRWEDSDQLGMHTLNYHYCKAIANLPDDDSEIMVPSGIKTLFNRTSKGHLSLWRRPQQLDSCKALPALPPHPLPPPPVRVVQEEQRQQLTPWPETKDDFHPRLGFFALGRGTNGSLTSEEQRLIITSFICVTCLAGGVGKVVDYGLMMRLFPEFTSSALSKFWLTARKERRSLIQKITAKFEAKFPGAYQRREVPSLDTQDMLNYDWKWLVKWAMDLNLHDEDMELPDTRGELVRNWDGEDTYNPEIDWRDTFHHRQASARSRMASFKGTPQVVPIRAKPKLAGTLAIAKARSYIKSLCCLPASKHHSPEEVMAKLVSLGPNGDRQAATRLLQEAACELNAQKVTIKGNAHHDPVEGAFRLNASFMKRLDKCCKLDRFEQAVAFKADLDTAFVAGRPVELRYDAGEGVILSVMNMTSCGRLKMEGVDIPHIPAGFESGNYETRKFDSHNNLKWKINLCRGETWLVDKDIDVGSNPRLLEIAELGPNGEVPMWRNLFGTPDAEIWVKALSFFLFTLATKGPSPGATDFCRVAKPYLEPFESELLFGWSHDVGLVTRTFGATGCYTTAEWWWWGVGKVKLYHCGHKEVVVPHRLKRADEQPVLRGPRKRHATIAVRHAAQEVALRTRKEERRREKEELKRRGEPTRAINKANIQSRAEKLLCGGHGDFGGDPPSPPEAAPPRYSLEEQYRQELDRVEARQAERLFGGPTPGDISDLQGRGSDVEGFSLGVPPVREIGGGLYPQ